MWKGLIVILILGSLVFPISVYAREFRVQKVLEADGYKEAVIEDRQTGEVWQVREGGEVEGWKVIEITNTLVTVEKMVGPSEALRAQIPVRGANIPTVQPAP